MKDAAQVPHTSTQSFIEIRDIQDTIVLLRGGNACIVIQVSSINFALMSKEEQDAKVYGYASLLNSLSFPVQIMVRSKRLDITAYLASLEVIASKTANLQLAESINKYKSFVENLIKMTIVLDKQCYIVIPYTLLEGGFSTFSQTTSAAEPNLDELYKSARPTLHTKAESVMTQVERVGLRARILDKDELVKLYYDTFNQDGASLHPMVTDVSSPILKGGNK